MDRCGVERAAVVGFSLGGMIARRVALDRPDRISALAILNSPHDRSPAEREAVRERVRQTEVEGPSANVGSALERWFTPAFRAEAPETIALVRTWIMRNDPAVYPQIYRVLAEGDAEIARGLDRIACPTLVMTGADDPGNTPAMARAMAQLIPGARLAILPGLRHMALAENPASGGRAARGVPPRRALAERGEDADAAHHQPDSAPLQRRDRLAQERARQHHRHHRVPHAGDDRVLPVGEPEADVEQPDGRACP